MQVLDRTCAAFLSRAGKQTCVSHSARCCITLHAWCHRGRPPAVRRARVKRTQLCGRLRRHEASRSRRRSPAAAGPARGRDLLPQPAAPSSATSLAALAERQRGLRAQAACSAALRRRTDRRPGRRGPARAGTAVPRRRGSERLGREEGSASRRKRVSRVRSLALRRGRAWRRQSGCRRQVRLCS